MPQRISPDSLPSPNKQLEVVRAICRIQLLPIDGIRTSTARSGLSVDAAARDEALLNEGGMGLLKYGDHLDHSDNPVTGDTCTHTHLYI